MFVFQRPSKKFRRNSAFYVLLVLTNSASTFIEGQKKEKKKEEKKNHVEIKMGGKREKFLNTGNFILDMSLQKALSCRWEWYS